MVKMTVFCWLVSAVLSNAVECFVDFVCVCVQVNVGGVLKIFYVSCCVCK